MLQHGYGQPVAILAALDCGLASTAVFAVLSLRATGIGFIMITLALGEILWGLAYRWISITGGDNGISLHSAAGAVRPRRWIRRRLSITRHCHVRACRRRRSVFVRSPLGAALMGTRDQPRRMNALGYHVWAIRFWACMFSGLADRRRRHSVRLLHAVHQPADAGADRLGRSAADGDLGRRRHPARPDRRRRIGGRWSRAW